MVTLGRRPQRLPHSLTARRDAIPRGRPSSPSRRPTNTQNPSNAPKWRGCLTPKSSPPTKTIRQRPQEVIALLEGGGVTEVSLDHDLGDDERGTGYDVVLWVEEAVAMRGFVAPKLLVHSANSSARAKMEQGIAKIERLTSQSAQTPNKSL